MVCATGQPVAVRQLLLAAGLLVAALVAPAGAARAVQTSAANAATVNAAHRSSSACSSRPWPTFAHRHPRRAIAKFRAILSVDPAAVRVRLELARAYFLIGDDKKAEYHFRLALGGGLPPSAAAAARTYLTAIRHRRNWSVSFSTDLSPQTNVNHGADAQSILIGGLPFTLNADGKPQKGFTWDTQAAFLWRPALGNDWRLHVELDGFNRYAASQPLRERVVGGELGLIRQSDLGEIAGGVRVERSWVGDTGFQSGMGPWLTAKLDPSATVSIAARLQYMHFTRDDGSTAHDITAVAGISRQVGATTTLKLGGGLSAQISSLPSDGYLEPSVSAGFEKVLPADFILGVDVDGAHRGYDGRDPLFGVTRTDWRLSATARVVAGGWAINNLAPYIQYRFEWNDSNIAIYDYTDHSISLGLTGRY